MGTLTLRVRPSRDRRSVVIQVSDTGHGIPSHLVDRIFEPFFTTREANENTGLGLAVCYGIIENHRGAINVHSAAGQGTTFTVMLPVAAAQAAAKADPSASPEHAGDPAQPAQEPPAAAAPSAAPVSANPKIVLIADRDEDLRDVLRESLQSRGYQVRIAADGLEALAEIMRNPIDLALLELVLTGPNGMPLLQAVRERQPDLPVIVLAAVTSEESAATLERFGVRACLTKPFEAERLFQEIAKAIAARHVA